MHYHKLNLPLRYWWLPFLYSHNNVVNLLLRKRLCILSITSVPCSPLQDDFFVLQVANEYDSLLESIFKTELLHVLTKKYEAKTQRKLTITFANTWVHFYILQDCLWSKWNFQYTNLYSFIEQYGRLYFNYLLTLEKKLPSQTVLHLLQ